MIEIAEIFVFDSPFDKREQISTKIRKLESSLGDFCTSVLGVESHGFSSKNMGPVTVSVPNYRLSYAKRDTAAEWGLDPLISLQVRMTPGSFDPKIIGIILSEISGIFKGNFYDQFFVEVASEYPLAQYARGNDLNLQKLESFDLDRPNSIKNKNTLNHLLYLRHQLYQNLLRSLQLRKDIDNATRDAIFPLDWASNLALFAGRMSSVEKSLYARMMDIEKIITHFISLL